MTGSLSARHGLFPSWVRTTHYKQNTTPHWIVSTFCITSSGQFIRLICGEFFCWAAILCANKIMQWVLEIQKWNSLQTLKVKRWQLHSSLLLACKKLIRLLVQRLFPAHTASRVRGFKIEMKISWFVWQTTFMKMLYLILWVPITGFQNLFVYR